MTNSQQRVITEIKTRLPYFDFYSSDDYEIKEFEVTDYDSFVSVYIVTGMINDEGTMAACLCRKYRHGFIGKKGGLSYMNGKSNRVGCSVFEFLNERYHN